MPSLGVCIATYERPERLATALACLSAQTTLPDEIVVSDASAGPASKQIVDALGEGHPRLQVRYVRSECRVLPWQRWLAFTYTRSETVLFLDDDIELQPTAIDVLTAAYREASRRAGNEQVAGIGFALAFGSVTQSRRNPHSFRERWLGTRNYPGGTVTPGGLQVPLDRPDSGGLVNTDWLSGGAMSYPRSVLERIGLLDRLVALYEAGIGRSEDAVLSSYARRLGPLYMILEPLAIHPSHDPGEPKPYAKNGWRHGMMATWGRAHTLRWMAMDDRACRKSWLRLTVLEVARAGVSLAKYPHRQASWSRLGGVICGMIRSLACWSAIPRDANSSNGNWQAIARGEVPPA